MIRVLFICLGNICRSPMAEAVFRSLVEKENLSHQFDIESAGIGNWHVGNRPHHGTIKVLSDHNIDIGTKRAQQLTRSDFDSFDYIVAMDDENVSEIQSLFSRRVQRLLEFAPSAQTLDVPDPYYSGKFDLVYQLVLEGCQGLLVHIREKEGI